MDSDLHQATDPQITTVETIITNDDLESDEVGEVIEAETYTDDFEVGVVLSSVKIVVSQSCMYIHSFWLDSSVHNLLNVSSDASFVVLFLF